MKTPMIGNEYKSIRRGVRQGYVLSPGPFNIYSGMILREICDWEGIKVVCVNKQHAICSCYSIDSRLSRKNIKAKIYYIQKVKKMLYIHIVGRSKTGHLGSLYIITRKQFDVIHSLLYPSVGLYVLYTIDISQLNMLFCLRD